jgi:hypothetical protein
MAFDKIWFYKKSHEKPLQVPVLFEHPSRASHFELLRDLEAGLELDLM